MKRIIFPICLSLITLLSYSQQFKTSNKDSNIVAVTDISIDSLTNLLNKSFSTVNTSDYYKITVTPNSEEISPVTSKTKKDFINKNIERYVSGDTLRIMLKDNNTIKNYMVYKTK